jgi:hypothetical protein
MSQAGTGPSTYKLTINEIGPAIDLSPAIVSDNHMFESTSRPSPGPHSGAELVEAIGSPTT